MNKKREMDVNIPLIKILNIPIHNVTMEETLQLVTHFFEEPYLHQIVTVNPEFVMTAQDDPQFRLVLGQADLSIPDGIGLIMASRWQGEPLVERIPGSELVYHLAELSAQQGKRLFLLGAAPGIAEKTASVLKTNYPGLIIAGTHAGSPDGSVNDSLVSMINNSRADLLFVAYGAPKQDKWIARNRENLNTVRVAMGVGGTFDFISGKRKRAPVWVQGLYLEWLYRLIQEPWRWKRMMALPRFAIKVLFSPRN